MENDKCYDDDNDEKINKLIIETWNTFTELHQTHPDDINDFHQAIHMMQYVMGMRRLRREHPEVYPTHRYSKR